NAADIGMRDLPCNADFSVKSGQQIRVLRRFFRKELQCDRLTQLQIVRAIDFAHASRPHESENAVTAGKNGAGRKAAFIDKSVGRMGRALTIRRYRRDLGLRGRERRGADSAETVIDGHFARTDRASLHRNAYSNTMYSGSTYEISI